mmetsp:Transcript_23517/g.35573  ORF Transcript_23517/g.35573 Transcript_23517/m.35573 type:complete len:421 (+) Transcript_23517:88-1350(+)|eukprot:CAMPEP_0194204576 /NCGR_PEP_ID=MMETSP0156-20130528/4056_1 /TAXON_ID=33649 /ORGANISM="Thalassionema nitzschioides, Strain L26-B" /LENGTH=420 /DNA_ID=CAMNT_0038930625 /DNA_START=8 /DNA_END=1270 /DNA_ORIENTATION=+
MTKKSKIKYKKAPQAPRRFKSAYMFFSTCKHKEIREELGAKGTVEKTTNIAKLVSQAWKELSPEERNKWDELARKDKLRYEVEKSMYTGPWKVPAKKLSQKDPAAPKRPMSAFLAFSHSKRASVKSQNATMNNAEISRVLAQMWKDASSDDKKEYIDKEYGLRQTYLTEIAIWREKTEKELSDQRKHREDLALQTVAARGDNPLVPGPDEPLYHAHQQQQQQQGSRNHGNTPTNASDAEYYSSANSYYNSAAAAQHYAHATRDPYYMHAAAAAQQQQQSDKYGSTITPPSVAEYFEGGYPPEAYGGYAHAAAAQAAGGPYGGYYYPPMPPPPPEASAAGARGDYQYPQSTYAAAGAYGDYPQQQLPPPQGYRQAYGEQPQSGGPPPPQGGEDPYAAAARYGAPPPYEGGKEGESSYAQGQ